MAQGARHRRLIRSKMRAGAGIPGRHWSRWKATHLLPQDPAQANIAWAIENHVGGASTDGRRNWKLLDYRPGRLGNHRGTGDPGRTATGLAPEQWDLLPSPSRPDRQLALGRPGACLGPKVRQTGTAALGLDRQPPEPPPPPGRG